jgi:hypothetical protein
MSDVQNMLFAALRSQLERPPGADSWKGLWQLTLRWPDDEETREQLIPYALDHLSAWPDAMRVAPGFWGDLALRGKHPPAISLARVMNLPGRAISASQAAQLSSCGALAQLHTLDLSESTFAPGALAALLGGELSALRELRLSKCGLRRADANALASWPGLATLDTLNLNSNNDLPLSPLFGAPHLGVANLHLGDQALDVHAARALALNPGAARLKSLSISPVRVEAGALDALAQSPHLVALETLHLNAWPWHPGELLAILDAPQLTALREVTIMTYEPIPASLASQIAASPQLARLTALTIPTSGDGAAALAASPHLSASLRRTFAAITAEEHARSRRTTIHDGDDEDEYEEDWE